MFVLEFKMHKMYKFILQLTINNILLYNITISILYKIIAICILIITVSEFAFLIVFQRQSVNFDSVLPHSHAEVKKKRD